MTSIKVVTLLALIGAPGIVLAADQKDRPLSVPHEVRVADHPGIPTHDEKTELLLTKTQILLTEILVTLQEMRADANKR